MHRSLPYAIKTQWAVFMSWAVSLWHKRAALVKRHDGDQQETLLLSSFSCYCFKWVTRLSAWTCLGVLRERKWWADKRRTMSVLPATLCSAKQLKTFSTSVRQVGRGEGWRGVWKFIKLLLRNWKSFMGGKFEIPWGFPIWDKWWPKIFLLLELSTAHTVSTYFILHLKFMSF